MYNNKFIEYMEFDNDIPYILYKLKNGRIIIIRSYILNKSKFYGNYNFYNSMYSGITISKYNIKTEI